MLTKQQSEELSGAIEAAVTAFRHYHTRALYTAIEAVIEARNDNIPAELEKLAMALSRKADDLERQSR
jgi:hypothetical protein